MAIAKFFALSFIAFFLTASIAGAAVFLDDNGRDPRKKMNAQSYPWSTIGRVVYPNESGRPHYCTGTLVGTRTVLTAAHCVAKNGKIMDVTFQLSYRMGTSKAESKAKFILAGTTDFENQKSDWAVISLEDPLGEEQGYLGIKNVDPALFPLAANFAGYSYDYFAGEIAGASACSIMEQLKDGTLGHNCSMMGGASGGGLIAQDSDGKYYIAGINIRGLDTKFSFYSAKASNVAIMNNELIDAVEAFRKKYE